MGTSGNREGYKVFSFNTSVRNPKRNIEFLKAFEKFDGKLFDTNASHAYLCELVKWGVYKFVNVPEYIKEKWSNNIELTEDETNKLFIDNPQATGWHNRVLTSYMTCLKDQGFLIKTKDTKTRHHIYKISKLGHDLINQKIDNSIVYTKVMIGLHANNPTRTQMFNKSRPFLNSIFVINEVNRIWKSFGNEPKGVLRHEFATFILGMKDCDWKKAAQNIIEYRMKYRYEINLGYLNKFMKSNGILPIVKRSLISDYPDDVFRKFEMTGLFISHGKFSYIYYNFSEYNIKKIELIIEHYKNYKFEEFDTADSYYNFLSEIIIPWDDRKDLQKQIIKSKAEYLGKTINKKISILEAEKDLDANYYSSAIAKTINNFSMKLLLKELMILSGLEKSKSTMDDLPEPLRLEYLITLCFGKTYGVEGLVSNIVYNNNGEPMHFAAGGQCDIMVLRDDNSLIFEPTMITTRNQQWQNETAPIVRHAQDLISKYHHKFRTLMVAPKVHRDTIEHFAVRSYRSKIELLALSISKLVGMFVKNKKYTDFISDIDETFNHIMEHDSDTKYCADYVNNFIPDKKNYTD